MAEHIRFQRYHIPIDLGMTPQIQQPVSLTTLPTEILAAIIGLLLPEGVRTAAFTESYPYSWTEESSLQNDDRIAETTPRNENKWSFVYISRRFHAEGVRYLHSRRYIIDITEKSLFPTMEKALDAAFKDDPWGNLRSLQLRLPQVDLICGPPFTDGAFPGLMLSQVKELMICIHPTDLGSFWRSLNHALDSLCNSQLLRRGPIKSLTIDLQDMTYSELWSDLAWGTADPFCLAAGSVAFEDYEAALARLKQAIALSGRCEIHLPYWVDRCQQKNQLLQTYAGESGARVFFSPAPERPKDEANERDRQDLVALPREYLPSALNYYNGQ